MAEEYAEKSFNFKNEFYKIIIQCRLRPDKIKIPKKKSYIPNKIGNSEWDNDYYIVNDK